MTQTVTALPAIRACETLGIVVNMSVGEVAQVAAALDLTGISLIRAAVNGQRDVDRLRALKALVPRLRVDFLVTAYSFHPATWAGQQGFLEQVRDLGVLESVEGPNEMNAFATHAPDAALALTTDAEKSAAFGAWAKTIRSWVDEHAAGRPTYSPTVVAFGETAWRPVTADVSGSVTAAAFHLYPGVGQASNLTGHGDVAAYGDLPTTLRWAARAIVGRADGPAVLTETGCPGSAVPQIKGRVVDLQTQAKICLNILMDGLSMGLRRVIFYHLWDNASDPRNTGGAEQHYGFFDKAWTPKPIAIAIGRLQALLDDRGADSKLAGPAVPRPAVRAPAVMVTGMDSSVSAAGTHLVIARSDGSVLIAVWNEAKLWISASGTPVPAAPLAVHVVWGENRRYSEFDILQSVLPVANGAGTGAVLVLRGYPIFLLLHT